VSYEHADRVQSIGDKEDISSTLSSSDRCSGSASRLVLDTFTVVWAPIRTLREQELYLANAGAKPNQQSLLCCNIHTRSFQARYVLTLHSTLGISFPFAEDRRFKAWNKGIALTRFQVHHCCIPYCVLS
jgi:hypothetical protein